MNRRKKCRFRRSVLSTATALAMVISSMVVPQGEAAADTVDGITIEVDTQSPYVATQIVNGDFESDVWESYVLKDGITYTSKPTTNSNYDIQSAIPNGVGMGWNTTENKTYRGSLFEVWPLNNLPAEKDREFPTANGANFIEMNANNSAALYQDLATQGGDVIKWTLQHAARTGLGFKEQRMYVTIGNPKREADGAITPATGVNSAIDTKIQDTGKAVYRYDKIEKGAEGEVKTAFANLNELKGLSVMRTDLYWHDVAGIYIVPEGQEVTRFAFCADASSKQDGDKESELSGGNFLDNITFSTLIGNIKANKQTDNSVEITGYWGDEGDKSLIVEYQKAEEAEPTKQTIDMSTVKNQNFKITVPESTIGDATSVKVYHQDYQTAVRDIPIKHAHTLSYAATENKLSVSCSNTETPCLGEENQKELTLNASNAVYSGNPYIGAALNNEQKTDWIAAGLDVPRICYEKKGEGEAYVSLDTAPTDVGTYRANITAGGATATATFEITPKSVTDSSINIASPVYDGTTNTPTIKDGSKVLVKGTDYTLTGDETGNDAKNYSVTITGIGNYGDTVTKTWTIQKATMKNPVEEHYSGFYDGHPHSASVSVSSPEGATIAYSDSENGIYTVDAPSYTNAGEYTIYYRITKENYNTKSGTLKVKISPNSIAENWIIVSPNSYEWDGTQKTPEITVKDGDKVLMKDTDYTVSGNTTESGISGEDGYKINIEGKGNYTGSVLKTWQITPKPQHQITLETDGHGTVSASVEGAAVTTTEAGKEVTLTVTPNSGYKFKKWTVSPDGLVIAGNKFTMPDTDVTVKAEFEATQSESGGGSGSGGTGSGGSSGSGESGSSGSNPSTPSTPASDTTENASENFVIPVKNENTVKVEAEIKSGTAKVSEITTDTIEKVVENTEQESKVDTITIDLSGAKQEITGVTLSKKSVETLAKATADGDNGIETATIELSKATVVLDNKTLETLVADAKGVLIELVVTDKEQKLLNTVQQTSLNQHEVATTFEAYFTSDGERIHDFKGGKAVVSIDFTPEAGKDTSFYHMVYVPEDGNLFRYKTKYENGKLMFTTTHFSDYAVIYDTNEKNMTGETEDEEEKKDSDTSKDIDEKTDTKVTMDTTYSRLRLRIPKSTRTTNVLKWTRESGADGYVIYGNKCNTSTQTYKMVQKVVIPNGATTTWTDTKLQKSTYYKYYIKAYKLVDGKKVWLAKSKVVHSTTTGGKYGNAKAVKVNKTTASLAVGKTFTIKAEQILKDLPILKHTEIQFESSNSKVASVNRKGIIKAKKKGICTIYVYAQNGVYKKIKVTVT